MSKKKIGEYYKSKSTFKVESNKFLKGVDYQLVDIIEEDYFNLYIFKSKNGQQLFGDFDDEFDNKFILLKEERAKNINILLYED